MDKATEIDTTTEYRVVCKSWDQPGHHEHRYTKGSLELSKRYAKALDDRVNGDRLRAFENPHHVQVRRVSPWISIGDGFVDDTDEMEEVAK